MNSRFGWVTDFQIIMPIPAILAIDAITSFPELDNTRKPLNLWYIGVALNQLILASTALITRHQKARLSRFWKWVLWTILVLSWIATIILADVGYFWVQQSWGAQPKGVIQLPMRYKFVFSGLLFLLVFAYSPIVIIPGLLIQKFYKYAQNKYKNFKLQKYYGLIYDAKFNIRKILPKLDEDWFSKPMSKPELKIIKQKFSEKMQKDQKFEDLCGICLIDYSKRERCTTQPGCEHQFHFKCLKIWLVKNHTCPVCRSEVRKNMIEHYHGPFELQTPALITEEETSEADKGLELSVVPENQTGEDDNSNDGGQLRAGLMA